MSFIRKIRPITLAAGQSHAFEACGVSWFTVGPKNPAVNTKYKIDWPSPTAGSNTTVEQEYENVYFTTPDNASIQTCQTGPSIEITCITGTINILYRT